MSMSCSPSFSASFAQTLCHKVWGALFGEEIEAIREEKGLSVDEAARRAGVTAAAWEAVEAGRAPQSWEQVCALAEGLGESRLEMASLVILHAGAWDRGAGQDLPGEIRRMYS